MCKRVLISNGYKYILMHYLSHYYTEIGNNNPLFVVALTIPDLAPGFSKVYNQVLKNAPEPAEPQLKAIHRGIMAHYAADKRFHNSALFMQQVSRTIQSMVDAGLDRSKLRLSVIAHIAVEMLLDRQIVIQQPHVCNHFYQHIDNATDHDLIAFFNLHSLEVQKREFLSKFQFFKEMRFLYKFNELENIVYALNKVYGMVMHTEFTNDEKNQFLQGISNIDDEIRYNWQEILNV